LLRIVKVIEERNLTANQREKELEEELKIKMLDAQQEQKKKLGECCN
jgi:hypothetical protein